MMLKELALWPQKLKEGVRLAKDFVGRYEAMIPRHITNIVFVGMGGSGIAGRIIKTFIDRKSAISACVIDSCDLPANIGVNTLAIVVSYSGNTWETLAVLSQLSERFIPTIVLASGGKAVEYAEKKNIPFVLIPQAAAPRAALGYFLGFIVELLDMLNLLHDAPKIDVLCRHAELYMPKFEDEQFFKKFLCAVSGYDFFHIWGISGLSGAFAYRAQTQFNENSKVQAVYSSFPELTHNLINGFEKFDKNPCVIFFTLDFLPVTLSKAVEAACEILHQKGVVLYKPPVLGNTLEEQLFNIILWSDYASYYLGKARGIDVEGVKIITALKETLKAKGIK
jgi:glucose/mannose-6-phosphate isomerase